MSETVTATLRDRVWATALDLVNEQGRVTVAAVLNAADLTDSQRDTTRDVLNAMADVGHVEHESGSPVWRRPTEAGPTLIHLRDRNVYTWTFRDPAIREWVEARLSGRVLNLCAGKTRLTHDGEVVRNDIDPDIDAEFHFDAVDVADHFRREFDTVLLDPPWGEGVTKRRPLYNGEYVDDYARLKGGVAKVVRPGGRVILFGYDTSGLGEARGFHLEEVATIQFTGNHRDVLVTVERFDADDGE